MIQRKIKCDLCLHKLLLERANPTDSDERLAAAKVKGYEVTEKGVPMSA